MPIIILMIVKISRGFQTVESVPWRDFAKNAAPAPFPVNYDPQGAASGTIFFQNNDGNPEKVKRPTGSGRPSRILACG
ncbi:hypothetical protein [Bradyrhizobium lupini]